MSDIALRSYPEECCGFLFGYGNESQASAVEVKEVTNADPHNKHRHFTISPASYLMAERLAEKKQLALLGIFHSHPDQVAKPSNEDLTYALPNFYYIIISLTTSTISDIRCWKLDRQRNFKQIYLHHITL